MMAKKKKNVGASSPVSSVNVKYSSIDNRR